MEISLIERAKQVLGRGDSAAARQVVAMCGEEWGKSSDAVAVFLLGVAQHKSGQLAAACTSFKRALELQPALIAARTNLCQSLLEQHRAAEAVPHAEEALRREPDNADRHFLLAYCLQQAKELTQAISTLRRAVVSWPRDIRFYVNLDALLLIKNDLKGCRALAELAIRQSRSAPPWRFWTYPLQRPPHMRPGLRAQPFWDAAEFPWMRMLEENARGIAAELAAVQQIDALEAVGGRLAHDGSLVTHGSWREFVLMGGFDKATHLKRGMQCPLTTALLVRIGAVASLAIHGIGEALFSALEPGTVLRPHCGSTNARLTCHLGLSVKDGEACTLRVGDQTRCWEEGRCLVFDDSFEHEVHHSGAHSRVILLINFWHPDVPHEEWDTVAREMLGMPR